MIGARQGDRVQPLRRVIALLVLTTTMRVSAPALAESDWRLHDREPFDQLVLTSEFGNVAVPVFRLPPDVRGLASKPPAGETLRVRLIDYPDRLYDIKWGDIAKVELFEDLLLKEANRLARAGEMDDAYRCLDRLHKIEPNWPGLEAGLEGFLFLDAAAAFRNGHLDEALSVLDEIRRRDPDRKGLATAIVRVAGQVFDQYVASGNYRSAWHTIDWAGKRVTDESGARTMDGWARQLKATAREHRRRAEASLSARDYRSALLHIENALRVWPADPEANALSITIRRAYPRLVIGVTRRRTADPHSTHDWGYRRFQRLKSRRLLEARGYYADGLKYESPFGMWTTDEDQQGMIWTFPDDRLAEFNAYDLAALVGRLRVEDLPVIGLWSQLAPTLTIEEANRAHLRVARPLLRWSYVLHVPVVIGTGGNSPLTPYLELDENDRQVSEVLNPDYLLKQVDQPSEIVERHFDRYQALIEELRSGSLDAVDRVGPDEVRRLANTPDLLVEQYVFPSVHFLVPNTSKPLMASRTFRRALLYGMSRKTILQQDLLGGKENRGCQVLSAPLPRGSGDRDPLAYAYDPSIQPREYDPALAITLVTIERRRLIKPGAGSELAESAVAHPADSIAGEQVDSARAALLSSSETDQAQVTGADQVGAGPTGADRTGADPTGADRTGADRTGADRTGADRTGDAERVGAIYDPLVIVHPDDPMAQSACQAICRYWEALGIGCSVRPLPPGVSRPDDDDWDLWYTDAVMMEPIVDVQRLFGFGGVLKTPSPYINLALGDLASATRWTDARNLLYEIHQMLHRELPVLPLWQMTDYCIYRSDIQGRPPVPVTFYEGVESWRLVPQRDLADLP